MKIQYNWLQINKNVKVRHNDESKLGKGATVIHKICQLDLTMDIVLNLSAWFAPWLVFHVEKHFKKLYPMFIKNNFLLKNIFIELLIDEIKNQ